MFSDIIFTISLFLLLLYHHHVLFNINKDQKISHFMALYNCYGLIALGLKLIFISLTYYNPLIVSLSSAQLLNAECESKRSSRYHFQVFG